ncbi:EAL and HDOD domain-containing protein [Rheinheimera mangrovi]|jgi:EAL and modified HD-GYP domain-containing signal transduction protein|uniref:EAL and HDOD domain-containing protein n=1 Tax=Rheinheimera mangrovi TaxID=2498451 RepID=UPI000F8EB832|nr:EAL domain-containing protein [Rheinheimera mangrovi]
MYCYVARQPIFDRQKSVTGYELLFRDGVDNCFPNIDADEATSKLITQHHLLLGVEKITGGKQAFINFSADTLIHHFPTSIDPNSMVIEILETVPISDELLTACKELHKMGYRLALDDHDFDTKWDVFLPYISIIKVDVRMFNILQISKYLRRIAKYPVTLLAEKVETADEYEQLKQLGFDLYQGYFFAHPEMLKHKQIGSNKLNLLALISESSKIQLDFDGLAAIVERDLDMSYKLLRFINSVNFARKQSIGSLKHAMVYMGEAELKKFISLLALANLAEGQSDELLVMSLIRARFCDRLANIRGDKENPPAAFLTGLFSLVDALLEQPLEELLAQLPLLPEIKVALLENKGVLAEYLTVERTFERGLWQQQTELSSRMVPDTVDLNLVYFEAVEWGQRLLAVQQH